jgi:anti-sigma factor RsiW
MRCSESTENLTAYLHHELSSADDLAMQEHLAECAACRDEHTAMREVMRRVQRVAPVEPSAQARSELHRSIDEAAGKPRLPGPAASPAQAKGKASPRAFLPFRKLRELPAPNENSTPAPAPTPTPNVAALSPSTRMIAERLEYLRHRKRNARVRRVAVYVFGLMLLAAAAVAYKHPGWFSKSQPAPVSRPEEARAMTRWNERHAATVRTRSVETLINDQAELGEGLSAPLRIIRHVDSRSEEACLIAYKESELKQLQASDSLEKSALEQELSDSRELFNAAGKPAIPAEWMDPVFGPDRRAVILNLADRIEIWSSTRLEKYLGRGPVFDSSSP